MPTNPMIAKEALCDDLRDVIVSGKQMQKRWPRSEGARLLAIALTQTELALFAMERIGSPGYEVEEEVP